MMFGKFIGLFDVSGGELLVILLFILIFFGSKGIPDLARSLGKGMREFKGATDSIKREILDSSSNIKKEITQPLDQQLEEFKKDVLNPIEKEITTIPKDLDAGSEKQA